MTFVFTPNMLKLLILISLDYGIRVNPLVLTVKLPMGKLKSNISN